ncbi:MAG: hypothetical protein F6K23_10730 [Okeania sp. SIO2C9]|uniref:hypothetical protein n=1 Tax=Okeania sp. SIO2C9 TaxID=2607791 RepID=UPI0013BFBC30|nr:hypothetical protein [Okeania sp. SIO2C9]NEQ73501.1 hypothetical protein [Okeania sp. SIO2C9]
MNNRTKNNSIRPHQISKSTLPNSLQPQKQTPNNHKSDQDFVQLGEDQLDEIAGGFKIHIHF